MADSAVTRVRHAEGHHLDLADFVDEQAYHLEQHRRHLIGAHAWGIVDGLRLERQSDRQLILAPGVAIDGYGRALIVPSPRPIESSRFTDRNTDVLDFWLIHRTREESPSERERQRCRLALGAERIVEDPALVWTLPDPASTDRRRPSSVPESDLAFGPERAGPAPEQRWPVFLGQVRYDPLAEEQPFEIDDSGRVYAGLVAERVVAASDAARLLIGHDPEPGTAAADRRFAVFVPEAEVPATVAEPRFAIDAAGNARIRGNTEVAGDVVVAGGAFHFADPGPVTTAPRPWRAYRHTHQSGGDIRHELRFELPATDTVGESTLVIGAWSSETSKFEPVLTIDATGKVTVHGDLILAGKDAHNKARAGVAPGFSEEAQQLLTAALFGGITGTGGAIANAVVGSGAVGPLAGPGGGLSGTLLAAALAQVVGSGAESSQFIQDLAKALNEHHADFAQKLRDALGVGPR
jgi:hypothetical protein